jgi:hypothetical protein
MERSRRFPGGAISACSEPLFEVAKLAPRQRHELALAHGKGQRGSDDRAALAVAGKMSERGLAGEHKGPRLTVGL